MKLATQTSFCHRTFGFEKAVDMIQNAGFDSLDFSMFCMSEDDCILNTDKYLTYAEEYKKYADKKGIAFTQAHAPFSFTISKGEDYYINTLKSRVRRSIEIASVLEIPVMIVHPLQFRTYSRRKNKKYLQNLTVEYYKEFLPLCEKYGVSLACENIWQTKGKGKREHIVSGACADPEEFIRVIDTVNSKYLTGCVDLGHCGLTGRNAADFIRTAGHDKVKALHVHDNDFRDDSHTLPGYGQMNWNEITKALADINYQGELTFEADDFLYPMGKDAEGVFYALKVMERKGRQLIEMIEKQKQAKSE